MIELLTVAVVCMFVLFVVAWFAYGPSRDIRMAFCDSFAQLDTQEPLDPDYEDWVNEEMAGGIGGC
jgi:hypothetical protein